VPDLISCVDRLRKNVQFSTWRLFAPVPVIITGRFAARISRAASSMAAGCGPGGYVGGDVIDPHEMSLGWIGEKSTSIGNSRRTGPCHCQRNIVHCSGDKPGGLDWATRIAWDTILGHSSGDTTR